MKDKILVTYGSCYGTTKQYASWIAEALGAQLADIKSLSADSVKDYALVIHGGGLYAGGISGLKRMLRYKPSALLIFTVGLADPEITDYQGIKQMHFSQEELSSVTFFHLRGGIDYKKLSLLHKFMMFIMKRHSEKNTSSLSPKAMAERQLFLDTYGKAISFVDKATIEPLLLAARQCSK